MVRVMVDKVGLRFPYPLAHVEPHSRCIRESKVLLHIRLQPGKVQPTAEASRGSSSLVDGRTFPHVSIVKRSCLLEAPGSTGDSRWR